jgi:deoxyribonuclease V
MEIPASPHLWNVSPRRAAEIQRRLAAQVVQKAPRRPPRLVAGVDAAFSRDGRFCIAGVVVWDRQTGEIGESRVARRRLVFPYVPGLLSFREAPAVIAALRKLRIRPDAIVCDGHGLAHPRRFGLACHVGLLTQRPTLGCAKSRLVGEHREPGSRRGSRTALTDRGEVVGAVLRTRDGVRPVFVSVGHRTDLRTAIETVLGCHAGYRLPEPTRLADHLVTIKKRK